MTKKEGYIPSLDGVRAVGIGLVMLLHGSYDYIAGGWIGVDLFFALSGYLITSILWHEFAGRGRVSLPTFYIRRAFRLFPALILCLLLSNVIWGLIRPLSADQDRAIATWGGILYGINLIQAKFLGVLGHLWSLSVEEHFYLLWPALAVYGVFRWSAHTQLWLVGGAFVGCSLLRIGIYEASQVKPLTAGLFIIDPIRFTFCRIDTLLGGVWLAIWLAHRPTRPLVPQNRLVIPLLLAILLLVAARLDLNNVYWHRGGFLLTDLLCVGIVAAAIAAPDNALLANRYMRWLGQRSYGIYLYHFPLFIASEEFRVPHDLPNFLLISVARFGLSLWLADLSYRYVEQPFLRYRKRIDVVKPVAENQLI